LRWQVVRIAHTVIDMTSDPTIKRRVDRLQNDTESIYELMGDFRTEFTEFRSETRGHLQRIEETMTEVVRRLPEST